MPASHRPRGAAIRAAFACFGLVFAAGFALGAELLPGVILAGGDLAAWFASRDPVSGSVYLLMLGVYAAMPWLRRGIATDHHDP